MVDDWTPLTNHRPLYFFLFAAKNSLGEKQTWNNHQSKNRWGSRLKCNQVKTPIWLNWRQEKQTQARETRFSFLRPFVSVLFLVKHLKSDNYWISNNNNITANISWINAILHRVWIVGFVKDDLSRVMGIWGRCKFAGDTFHGFCEAPGGFGFSALIWYWGSVQLNRCFPIREVRWWQFHAKWDVSLRELTNSSIRQGVSNSLRTTIKFTTRSRCLTQEINSSILQSVSNSLWTIIKFTTMSRWLTLEINSSIRQGVVDSLGHLSNLQQGGRWLTHYFHLYVIN